jgi:Bacterial Ig-like domain
MIYYIPKFLIVSIRIDHCGSNYQWLFSMYIRSKCVPIPGTALASVIASYFGSRERESAAERIIAARQQGVPEGKPPTIIDVNPVDGSTGVPDSSPVTVKFSEPIQGVDCYNRYFCCQGSGE